MSTILGRTIVSLFIFIVTSNRLNYDWLNKRPEPVTMKNPTINHTEGRFAGQLAARGVKVYSFLLPTHRHHYLPLYLH